MVERSRELQWIDREEGRRYTRAPVTGSTAIAPRRHSRGLPIVYDVMALDVTDDRIVSVVTETFVPAIITWDLHGMRSSRVPIKDMETWAIALSAGGRLGYISDGSCVRTVNTAPSLFGPIVTLWRRPSAPLLDHGEQIGKIMLSADGRQLASSGDDKLKVWSSETFDLLWEIDLGDRAAWQLGRSGPPLVSSESTVTAYDWSTGKDLWCRSWNFGAGASSADGSTLAACTPHGSIALWKLSDSGPREVPSLLMDSSVKALALDHTGDTAAITHDSGRLTVVDLTQERVILRDATSCESLPLIRFVGKEHVVAAGRDVELGPPLYVWQLR